MPVEVVSYMLSIEDTERRLQFWLVSQCAPFLKRLKTACIMNIEKYYCSKLGGILAGTDIEYRFLRVDEDRCLLFLYRQRELADYLDRADVRGFLMAYGYPCRSMEEILDRLSERVRGYSCRGLCFPHEIGVFLNYPVEDVRCFIEQKGKGGYMTGYWRVYHDPVKAQLIFQAYDKARTSAVNEYLTGKCVRDIAR